MNIPAYCFSDTPVPPSKSAQLCHLYALNKKTIFPVIKDAVLESILDPSSLSFKYAVTAANGEQILRPLSTCLPFGSPNRVANLQDLCSGTLPFAVHAQQWLRECAGRAPAGRPSTGKKGKSVPKTRKMAESTVEVDDAEDDDAWSKTSKTRKSLSAEDADSDPETAEDHGDVDPLLPFGNMPSIPDFKNFKPYVRDLDAIATEAKRATVRAGFQRLPPLNSPINWWYSGGCLSYISAAPENGFLCHASGSLTRLTVSPITLTEKRSFQRVVASEESPIRTVQMKAPIYQIESQFLPGHDQTLIYARLADEITVNRRDPTTEVISTIDIFPTDDGDCLTHISPSQYVFGEFLTASHKGVVSFRTAEARKSIQRFSIAPMEFKKCAKQSWTGCYFGAHPRDLCVATPCAVDVFDGRIRGDNSKSRLRLLSKKSGLENVANDIVAANLFVGRDSYHVMATTKEVVVVDSRFPKAPVLRYPCQATTSPAYLRTLTDTSTGTDMILASSQVSQQVMCFELSLQNSTELGPARMASVPFLTATPRQLIPQVVDAEMSLEFTMKQRLEKPIIGMAGITQPEGSGFTVAVLSALGDVFVQSFEAVQAASYETDGTNAFSTVQSDVKLHKKERRHLSDWLAKAGREVVDATMNDFVRPFGAFESSQIDSELSEKAKMCQAAVRRKKHPLCRLCRPNLVLDEATEIPDVACDRCHTPLRSARVNRPTGDGKFCSVSENNSTTPIQLPECLEHDQKVKELARTNRIAWKLLTMCYGENIPPNELLPEPRDMPPPEEKRRARKSLAARQNEALDQLMLDVPAIELDAEPVAQEEAALPEPVRLTPPRHADEFLTMAVSTQNDAPMAAPPESALRKKKKPKRLMGF